MVLRSLITCYRVRSPTGVLQPEEMRVLRLEVLMVGADNTTTTTTKAFDGGIVLRQLWQNSL